LKSAPGKSLNRSYLEKNPSQKLAGGVAQDVCRTKVQTPVPQKEKEGAGGSHLSS
jgi:hypothetical protein